MNMKIQKFSLFLAMMLFSALGTSKATEPDSTASDSTKTADTLSLQASDPVIDALDSLATSVYYRKDPFEADSSYLKETGILSDSLPSYPDSVYIERLRGLDRKTPLDFEYNSIVQAFIELYANKRRDLTSRVLGMKEIYFPMIEEKLDKHGIPLELKYLAIVESALNPTARSPAGATGLWQFMYRTGKLYGLEVDSYVDERRDPVRSTEAACEYLKFLYGIYEDWNLVLAAYNAGPGIVNRAMRRSGGKKDYWELRPYLPRETGGYVPAFVAVNYIMEHYKAHGLVPVDPGYRYFEFDTVHVSKPVTFDQISRAIDIPKDTLKMLNPVYRRGEVPATEDNKVLRLPRKKIGTFLANEDSIHSMDESPVGEDGYVTKEITEIHRVRRGEYLGSIAQQHGVRVSQIRAWNNIRGSRIHPGQRLTIHKTVRRKVEGDEKEKEKEKKAEDANADNKTASNGPKSDNTDTKPRYHTVRRGDTLWDIAREYNGVTLKKIRALNEANEIEKLRPGQRILIEEDPS